MAFFDELKKGISCNSVGKPSSILGRSVCLSVHPGKMMLLPFVKWFDKRYRGRFKFARLVFSFDLFLIGIALCLGIVAIFLALTYGNRFEDNIIFEATVAPREIQTGAESTLIIRYANETDEELRNARLSLTYPDHFQLQEISIGETPVEGEAIELGVIPVGGIGSVRVRGVMFGDVGGEQIFTSKLTFVHGKETDMFGTKISFYSFSPSSSTLKLSLNLPERLIAFQEVEGSITYENTGKIDFPEISIKPEWPEGLTYLSSDIEMTLGVFEVPAIHAGEYGEVDFKVYLGDVNDTVTFEFYPSFTFDTTKYQQEILTHTADIIPPQIEVEHSIDKTTLRPGAEAVFTLMYTNTGEHTVSDVVVGIESDSPFFQEDHYTAKSIDAVAPDETGTIEVRVPLRSSILQSETYDYNGLNLVTRTITSYTLGDGSGQRVQSKGVLMTTPLTTPVVFESFGRYTTPSGDQLGRGPLPPRVGSQTKYWIFWHVGGTLNELENVRIEGTLGNNVEFTGRQSTSRSNGVSYDPSTNTISWYASAIDPNLSPSSQIVGVAFELGITPDENMVGESPILLYDIHLIGTDSYSGAFVSKSGSTVTTNLPNDLMAAQKAQVEP